jgi:hypothetical protein
LQLVLEKSNFWRKKKSASDMTPATVLPTKIARNDSKSAFLKMMKNTAKLS